MDYLSTFGLQFVPNGHSLIQACSNYPLNVLYLRDDDIPEYVSRGVADLGIVGENILLEKRAITKIVQKLDFGKCRLVIAAPANSSLTTLKDLEGERIATAYPYSLQQFLSQKEIDAAIIPISGSVEITPELNLADAVCDIMQTGNTLKAHNLVPLVTILESQAVLISSPIRTAEQAEFLSELVKINV